MVATCYTATVPSHIHVPTWPACKALEPSGNFAPRSGAVGAVGAVVSGAAVAVEGAGMAGERERLLGNRDFF